MKSIKLKAFLLILAAFTLTLFTCENTDETPQDQDTDNTFLMRSMSELMGQFDDNGDSDDTQNPSGNMVMDFCFEFVFPIDFYLSNNTITTINSIEELVEVLINSDDDLYINDISYPFDVLVFNDDTNSIESLTIENDEVFASCWMLVLLIKTTTMSVMKFMIQSVLKLTTSTMKQLFWFIQMIVMLALMDFPKKIF